MSENVIQWKKICKQIYENMDNRYDFNKHNNENNEANEDEKHSDKPNINNSKNDIDGKTMCVATSNDLIRIVQYETGLKVAIVSC